MTTTDQTVSNLIINVMTRQQYEGITPSDTELYMLTDETITASDVTNAIGYTPITLTTNQAMNVLTYASSLTVVLSDEYSIYKLTPSGSISSMTFDASGIISSGMASLYTDVAYTFELYLDLSSATQTITWPSNLTWQDSTIPDLSNTGKYLFAFRTFDGGTTWISNLQGMW